MHLKKLAAAAAALTLGLTLAACGSDDDSDVDVADNPEFAAGTTMAKLAEAGKVTVGFMTDTGLVPDPQPLVKAFEAELRTLCR